MRIDVRELLGNLTAICSPGVRIGYPDEPSLVRIVNPRRFTACLDDALRAFSDLRSSSNYIVCADRNECNRAVRIRFVKPGASQNRNGHIEKELAPSFRLLRKVVARNSGELAYWGGDNYFVVSLPFRGPMRESFPEIDHLPWDERYLNELERREWSGLRNRVFRFSNFAESFAERCLQFGMSRVLIPSVGLCVHPWQFAGYGLSVVATDAAGSALAALSEPDRWPLIYSRAAYVRWDLARSARCATQGNVEHFDRMPELEDQAVRESLRHRITFLRCDWADLPLPNGSVDAIFATNAMPRESTSERHRVLKEWVRVVRPGGIVFINQHNFFGMDVEPMLQSAGWVETNILRGERPAQSAAIGYQLYYSSG